MHRPPDHRFLVVQTLIEKNSPVPSDWAVPTHQHMLGLYVALRDKLSGDASTTESYAYELYQNLEHRMVLDAFLLANCPYSLISQTLGIGENVIEAYAQLFMDMFVFRNKLEVISYAKDYPGGPYAKEMIRTAVTVGYDYLLWVYGNTDEETVDSRFIVRKTMIDAFFRGRAHKGNGLTSAMAKEAKSWAAMAVSNAALIEKIDPRTTKAAVNELRIAIEGKDSTLAPDKAPVPAEDILH
jgi:hypothetical protein